MTFNPNVPYNDLPPLPPAVEVETKTILKRTITARSALAELKGLGATIPNQALLVDSLILQEAKTSSEIENIITTSDVLFRAFTASTSKIDSATKEVLRYREALWKGFNALQKRPVLSTNLFIDLVQTIKEHKGGISNMPGTVVANATTQKVLYAPPEGEAVIRDHLKHLLEFMHADDDMDPLVKLALIHYQFEAIHPFPDGNGRVGRIVNILFLIQQELLDLPVLYLSKSIIERKNDYYRLLRQVTEKDAWEPWLLFMLKAVEETAVFTRERIQTIRGLMDETTQTAKEKLPARVYSKELIETIFRQPYTKGQFLVDTGIAKRQTAAQYLREMESIGILKSQKMGKETLYLNVALYELLSR
jgi:Fic family protein